MHKVFLGVPTGVDGHIEMAIVQKPDLQALGSSLDVTISASATYGMGRRLLSCPFFHSEFVNPLGALMVVVVLILADCQSPVLFTSFLKEDFGGSRMNPVA